MKSPFQYQFHPDGTITLAGCPDTTLELIEEQGIVVGRNWQAELGLPTYYEQWEDWAQVRGPSHRHVRFVLIDASPSRLPGHPRVQPHLLVLPEQGCLFELGHTGFVIGVVYSFARCCGDDRRAVPRLLGFEIPADLQVEGDFIIGQAQLLNSRLSDAAWRGLQAGLLSHVCPMSWRPTEGGDERLVQVTLTTGDYPGCPHATILATWEAQA